MDIIKKGLILIGLSSTALFAYEFENKPDNNWSIYKAATKSYQQSIGSYANGCLAGAKSLPAEGVGFYDMRRNRNRYFGHENLINFIENLGKYTDKNYNQRHLIGDLSQARGGRMNFGHSSHQIGLDVDVWMQTVPKNEKVDNKRDMNSIVNKSTGKLINRKISPAIRDALYFSSQEVDVARIFVNPVVKKSLCNTELDRSWLRKLRPWWGHDEHFHVLLYCPVGDFNCKNQAEIADGSGCDAGLYNWVNEQSDLITGKVKRKSSTNKKRKAKVMPELCWDLRS